MRNWLMRAALLASVATLAIASLYLFLPLDAARSKAAAAAARSLPVFDAEAPGCKHPREIVHPFTQYPASIRQTDAGETIDAIVIKARYPCAPIDGPAVAFNWYTITSLAGRIADARYKAYAAPHVSRDAEVTSVVMILDRPRVLAEKPGAPIMREEIAAPLVHTTATMPFYPSPDATISMIDADAPTYFRMLKVKRQAIGETGYFGYQECLYQCDALRRPTPLAHNASRFQRIAAMRNRRVNPPLLVVHVAMPQAAIMAHADALKAAFSSLGSRPVLVYIGRTMADALVRTPDGKDHEGLQKSHWIDFTIAFNATTETDARRLLEAEPMRALLSQSTRYAALYYPR